MIDFFIGLSPLLQTVIACMFTLFLTMLGASIVFLIRDYKSKIMDCFISISAGIMLSSSIFSLIFPAINLLGDGKRDAATILSLGIFLGGLILFLIERCKFNKSKVTNLLIPIMLHNFPEGMAIGVAFASVFYYDSLTVFSALLVALGIGIQNIPEGAAISVPLYNIGYSRFKAFIVGGFTAIVEPLGGIVGALIAVKYPVMLPFLLSFAAGSMIYSLCIEMIPSVMQNKNKELMALYLIVGFVIMLFLDIALG